MFASGASAQCASCGGAERPCGIRTPATANRVSFTPVASAATRATCHASTRICYLVFGKLRRPPIVNAADVGAAVTLGTWNVHNIEGSRGELVDDVLTRVDILAIQEHWRRTIDPVFFDVDGFDVFASPAREAVDALGRPSAGRPSGGCALYIRSGLVTSIERIDSRMAHRLVGAHVHISGCDFGDGGLLVLACYFPCAGSPEWLVEYDELLAEIEHLAQLYPDCSIAIAADFNLAWDDARCDHLRTFAERLDLTCADFRHDVASMPTFIGASGASSAIDHVLISRHLSGRIRDSSVLEDAGATSDHRPLVCTIKRDTVSRSAPAKKGVPFVSRPRFESATSDQLLAFTRAVDTECATRSLVTLSADIGQAHITTAIDDIVDAIHAGAAATLPHTSARKPQHRRRAYWREVEPLYRAYRAAFTEWTDDKENLVLLSEYVKTRRAFKRAMRYHERRLNSRGVHAAAMAPTSQARWTAIRKARAGARTLPATVGGITGEAAIAAAFSDHFASVAKENEAGSGRQPSPCARPAAVPATDQLRQSLARDDAAAERGIGEDVVAEALDALNTKKAAGPDGLRNEHLRLASPI